MSEDLRRSTLGTLGALLVLVMLSPAPAPAQKEHVAASEWWPDVKKVEKTVRSERWKTAQKQAHKLAEEILGRSWYGPDLRRILAELALFQAVAEANLGDQRAAVWHWHMANNLDFKTRMRDLAPYGSAAKLLLEHPLRDHREVPVGFKIVRPSESFERPVMPRQWATPEIVNNTGAAIEGSGDCNVELIVDERGVLHHPVLLSTHLHPVVIYETLDHMRELRLEPARVDGEPADFVFLLTVKFHVIRW